MIKRISMILLVFMLIFSSMPMSYAHDGHGNTRLNVLYLSGSNTTSGNSPDALLAQYIDKYFVTEQDIKVYHKEIKNFSVGDLTDKDYSAIYIAASVLTDINNGSVDSALLNKLKAFDYPTVVENALAPVFGLANQSVDLHLSNGASGTVGDEVNVYKVLGHREFSLDVISDNNFNNSNFTYQKEYMYDSSAYKHGYDDYINYQAVSGLKSDAIVAVTTENLGGGTTYPMIYGYEPGQTTLANNYRVAGTYGTTTYSKYLSIDSIYLIANAVWWVLQEGSVPQTSFNVEVYDEVRDQVVSTESLSVSSTSIYNFSYDDIDHYEFLAWEKVYASGSVETVGDSVSFSEKPDAGVTYRARVQRVNTVEIQTFDTSAQSVISSDVVTVREGSDHTLSFEAVAGYDFSRWTLFQTSTETSSFISSSETIVVTPTGDAVYRAEVVSNTSLPSTLSILEVQPSNSYRLSASTISHDLGIDVTVTQMPMSLFIANRDQLNGLYDVIYFGNKSGIYTPLQDSSLAASTWLWGENPGIYTFNNSQNIGEFYAPNDITNLRADEVLEFVDSKQLVLFEKNIFTSSKNTVLKSKFSTIYNNSSNDQWSNVGFYNQVSNNQIVTLLRTYNGEDFILKPTLTINNRPLDFVSSNGHSQYQTDAADRYMTYSFELEHTNSDHDYEATLYLDFDGNNLFEDSEGENVKTETLHSENMSDITMKYNLPASYIGFVPWKIEVTDLDTNTKAYKLGYTAFKGESDDVEGMRHIRVLQITPNGGGNYELSQLPSSLTHIEGLYDLTIDQMTTSEFNANPLDINGNYDMIVLGFADSLSTVMVLNDAAIGSIQSFIDSGQSVLTTHDQFWFEFKDMNNDLMKVTKAFRDQFGQNIYAKDYFNGNTSADNETMLDYFSYGGTTYNSVGLTNRTINRNYYGLPTTNKSIEINEGQITLFPYILDDVLDVSTTHFQYYQLDLEREDLMVWHNLYGGSYDGLDARNDYYVYSIGNITYSGTGHASPKNYNDENELFVNTMIKASKTANHAPSIVVEDIMDGMTLYQSDSTIPISFTVSDLDIGDDTSTVKVYIDTDQDGVADYGPLYAAEVTNDEKTSIEIDKSDFNDDELFNIIIIAEDTSGAQVIQTITDVKNISTTALKITSNSTWENSSVLLGDTGVLAINLETTGEGSTNFSDISVSIKVSKEVFDKMSTSTEILGWSVPTVIDGYYIFTKSVTDISNSVEFTPVFDGIVGSIDAYITLNYSNYGIATSETVGPKKISVKAGRIIISAKDRFNRAISGAEIIVESPSDEFSVETDANDNVIIDAEDGSGEYTFTYYLDGYKDAEFVITYGDGTTETISRELGESYVTVTISLDGSNNPVDISLNLYHDVITSVSIDGGLGLVVAKENYNNDETLTVFKNMGDVNSDIRINFNLDEITSKLDFVFDDSTLSDKIVSGSGNYGFYDSEGDFTALLTDSEGNLVEDALVTYDAVNSTITVALQSGVVLDKGIYTLTVTVHFDKDIEVFTEDQPHVITLVETISDIYDDANDDGIYTDDELYEGIVKEINKSIPVGYLIFTDNTDLQDDQNGIVGFKTESTNVLEGAGYGDVQLYIKPSKDVSFENVNIQLILRYMEENVLAELVNDERFYISEITDVEGLDRESVSLEAVDGDETNQQIVIDSLPKADSEDNEDYIITIKIFVENSKFKFKDYRLVFSLIYDVNVLEAEINQEINIVESMKLR